MNQYQRSIKALVVAGCYLGTGIALGSGGDVFEEIGYLDLVARLGADTPTGQDIGVGQVEAPEGGGYGPDQSNSEFTGIVFTSHKEGSTVDDP